MICSVPTYVVLGQYCEVLFCVFHVFFKSSNGDCIRALVLWETNDHLELFHDLIKKEKKERERDKERSNSMLEQINSSEATLAIAFPLAPINLL